MTTVFSVAALKTELLTDPSGIGYSVPYQGGDDGGTSDLLNAIREGGAYQVDRDPVPPQRVFEVIDAEEYAALTVTDLARLQTAFTVPLLNLAVSSVQAILTGIFPNGSVTNLNILALSKRQGSRAEVLWGIGTGVTPNQVNLTRYT